MKFTKAMIIAPSFEQRVSKMAYCLMRMGLKCEVLAEEAQVADEFKNYVKDAPFSTIPCSSILRRTPLGANRIRFIREKIADASKKEDRILVIARDVNYGSIVTSVIKKAKYNNVIVVTDVADNYDLLYASYRNVLKRIILKVGFNYLTRSSFYRSDGLIIVTPVNYNRIRESYHKLKDKPIFVLRNVPLRYEFINNEDKIPNSMVYVGKIDEISRDPMYIIEKLKILTDFTLHFYSSQKELTINKIKALAEKNGISDRVVFHQRVPYDALAKEISKYTYGLVPHKRTPITDYTVPNKIYDYKSSGIITIMSDCPALTYENEEFAFGVVYSKEKDTFEKAIAEGEKYRLDFTIKMPVWDDEFRMLIKNLEDKL